MKITTILWLMLVMSACAAAPQPPQPGAASPPQAHGAPQQLTPPDNQAFVESAVEVAWDWPELPDNQAFALRVWVDETQDAPQEVWVQTNVVNIQPMIDNLNREIGTFYWQVAVVETDAAGRFEAMGSAWSEVRRLQRVRRLPLSPVPYEDLSDVARLVADQDFATTAEKIVYLQDWMHAHTAVGDDLAIYQPDYRDAVQAMYAFAQGVGAAPEMYCNGLSTSLLTVLRELGIESRAVFLYGEVPGWIAQHTLLEVFNPDTQTWQVYDPTINIYYRAAGGGAQVAMRDLVFGPLEAIEACDIGGTCSVERARTAFEMFGGAYRYGNTAEVFVNPERLDLSRRVEALGGMTFAEFIADGSSIPLPDLIFRFGA